MFRLSQVLPCCGPTAAAGANSSPNPSLVAADQVVPPPRSGRCNRRGVMKKKKDAIATATTALHVGRRRSISRSDQWQPSLASISEEENVLLVSIERMKASVIGSLPNNSNPNPNPKQRRRIALMSPSLPTSLAGRPEVLMILPPLTPPAFMF